MADEEAKMVEETQMTDTHDTEAQDDTLEGDGDASNAQVEESKTEEEMEQELKETPVVVRRYAPHSLPDWDLNEMRERWIWNIKIYPIDQEDCRNCLLDSATKIAQEAWYYVPKRKNGQGTAELSMASASEAKQVMGRIIRMPFYYRYVTIEVSNRYDVSSLTDSSEVPVGPFTEVVETASVVLDTTKCERIKNTAKTIGSVKRRNLWVRYLPENTSSDLLRVVFPLTHSNPEVQTHEDLRVGRVETNSKTDVLLFMKAYLTVNINGTHILALQNKEPENESETRDELEKSVTALDMLEDAPVEAADRSEMRKTDKAQTNRILKRTLHQQQKNADRRRDSGGKRGRGGEPPAKRGGGGGGGQWNDRRSAGSGGRFSSGYGGGNFGMEPRFGPRGGRQGFAGMMDPQGMATEMMMMQAQLNQTIQNQLMRLNPRDEPMSYGGGYGRGGSGGGGGGGGRRAGRGGSGRKNYGGGW